MQNTRPLASPVVTLLSRSPAVSRRAQSLLRSLFGMDPIPILSPGERTEDFDGGDMDGMFPPLLFRGRKHWDSLASRCRSSGAVLHLLSLSGGKASSNVPDAVGDDLPAARGAALSLLSVTRGLPGVADPDGEAAAASVLESRRLLASGLGESGTNLTALALKLAAMDALGRPIEASHLLGGGSGGGLPLLELPASGSVVGTDGSPRLGGESEGRTDGRFRLREVVLPYFDDATYRDGSTLPSRFTRSALSRPLVGMYQWPHVDGSGVAFRPLPAAMVDLNLSPPTFVFQCTSLELAQAAIEEVGATSAKVGFSGHGRKGQLMVKHSLLDGLDFRVCEASTLSSSFAEAQESLLAGSLEDLQSANIMAEGGTGRTEGLDSSSRSDAMNGLGDCWVEFRANLKSPSGFWKKKRMSSLLKAGNKQSKRVAKAPDIPYE